MPSNGRPDSSRRLSGSGASSSYTLDGPPESTRAAKPPPSTRSTGSVHGRISEYTPSSRMRRAMSWVYCPPKSRIATLLATRVLPRDPQLLGALEDLPLGLDRGRDDQLGLLQLLDVHGAHRAHAGADGAHEVQGPVLGERGAEQDLLERPRDAHPDARAARQVRVRRGHAPVVAAAGSFLGAREGGADHDRVGAGGEGLADVAAGGHPAVGDDRHVAAGPLVVEVARGRRVGGGGHLRHPEPQHLAARARRARTHPDQQRVYAAVHQLETGLVGDDVADDERDREVLLELADVHRGVLARDVPRGGHGGLHDEEVGARFLGDLGEALGALRDRGDQDWTATLLDVADPLVDQLFLDGLAIDALDDLGRFFQAGRGDAVQDRVGVLVAGEDAFQVEDREAPHPAHLDRERGAHHPVHGRRDDGDGEAVAAELPGDVDLAGVDGHGAGNQRDIIEAVRRPGLPAPPDPHAHTPRLLASPGLGPGPLPAIWTPYVENHLLRPTVGRGQVYERPAPGVNGGARDWLAPRASGGPRASARDSRTADTGRPPASAPPGPRSRPP